MICKKRKVSKDEIPPVLGFKNDKFSQNKNLKMEKIHIRLKK